MQCPRCTEIVLVMSERQGVEIDYCPQCRGVWLDRGELDKILERNAADPMATSAPPRQSDHGNRGGHHGGGKPYRKKRNFLSDLLDF